MGKKRAQSEGCETDMTPMIDVVFQLIIFFIVTIRMDEDKKDIILENSPHGPTIKEQDPKTSVIEVDKRGWISMHGAALSKGQLRNLLVSKKNRMGGTFPILIRGDYRTKHKDIRSVMDICTEIGIWRINFAAMKEKKT